MKMRITYRDSMEFTGFFFLCVTFLSGLGQGAYIKELRVPQTVLNGTDDPVILDCDYRIGDKEEGIEVKWFFNRGDSPVYQWVPGHKPLEFGILRDRLDLDYIASDEPWAAHRALSIKHPTTELTGLWMCKVSTFSEDAMKGATMIVFAPQKEMDIGLTNRPTPESINISCWASGVFPEPKLTITYGSFQLGEVITDSAWNEGAYDITVHKIVQDSDLLPNLPVIFDCELKIPNTSYIHRKNLLYAGPIKETDESNSAIGVRMLSTVGTFFYMNLLIAWILFRWT